jgi:type IV pilus assembly protein PilA
VAPAGAPAVCRLTLKGMRPRQRARAFTLIEMMIVIAMIGILATLAIVAYKRWVRTAYMAEAQDMVAGIRAAEETFKAEAGGYLPVSSALDVGGMYPAAKPGAFKTSWGAACTVCVTSTSWQALAVEPKAPVAFGYAVVADNTGSTPGANVTVALNAMQTPANLSLLAGSPWYVVEALGDINGDGVYTRIIGDSSSSQLFIDREGE